ncbi:uncharacterized protein CANTADRAFT_44922 [Suhomyces tanzawaensis NRRL Y-17324]|uniref:PH domain-containing protein n=1 Tax=Suhomyces tanzawaensis NRRL Y-17324 TaxID=984487 RepID=A0A1E4SQY1_9ASCO|nr:uncharacterized protein CANTADRAFT_44922 [Suhomyces tanzawaensis NRRL Y-17324]ODV81905.1 hypothetical protein CANTADRAFT_44922 [Suhomyces tanzawaensis NRRL Y-17324]
MTFDHNNPLQVSLPYVFTNPQDYPTEVMASRFQAWRSIIKDLVSYLKEYASVQEEIVRQQMRLQQAVGTSTAPPTSLGHSAHHNNAATARKEELNAINKFFLPIGNGSIQDIPSILTKFHQQNVTNASKTLKEINNVIIPKLEELRKDLQVKIKEIKNLQNDFKTSLGKEITETKALMNQYQQAITASNKLDDGSSQHHVDGSSDHGKNDPYLVKIRLDRQLKRQLNEENYLYQAYANLQNAGGNLESIVVLEIQNYLSQFLNLLNTENSSLPEFLLPNFNNGFLSKEATFEWNSFISRNLPSNSIASAAIGNNSFAIKAGTFIDLSFPSRKVADLNVPNFDSTLNAAVREGFLERRSKYLKSYSSGWYVLTCNYLHEFKTADRKKDQQPAMSLPLDSCTVTEHSKDDGKTGGVYKFILSSKLANGLMHRTHNWVFRTDTYKSMINWYSDIKALTSLPTPSSRARYLSKKKGTETTTTSKRLSRNSSVLSSGTAARSIKSGLTNASPPHGESHVNGKQRPLSQATSILNAHRLSSTFSQKNNQSPRLANMINSDGTIITPVDTFDDEAKSPEQPGHTHEQRDHENKQPSQSQVKNAQPSVPFPNQQFLTPQQNYPYYLAPQPGQAQPQQFYDPVQQQYFTLTPSMPNQGQHPQPQYFPASPQPNTQQQQFVSVPQTAQAPQVPGSPGVPSQPIAINTANYFPQYVQANGGPAQFGEALPYPAHLQPVITSTDRLSINEDRNGGEHEKLNKEHTFANNDVPDEVSTLQSNVVRDELRDDVDDDEDDDDEDDDDEVAELADADSPVTSLLM